MQANADLFTAKHLLESKDYYICAFASHQAAEKGLKALSLLKFRAVAVGHILVYLAKQLNVPRDVLADVQSLNPEYVATRHPDVINAAPVDIYNEKIAKERLAEGFLHGWKSR